MPTLIRPANAHSIVATGWTNPSNAFSTTSDDVYATALNGSTTKNIEWSGDFGFADIGSGDIPDGSTIDEVRIRCEGHVTSAVVGALLGVQGRISGANSGAEATTNATSDTEIVATLGTVTLANLRAASTVVKARCRGAKGNSSTGITVNLDYVRLEVDWTAAGNAFDETLSTTGVVTTTAVDTLGGAFDPVITFAAQVGTDVLLEWDPSPTPGVTDYSVFRRSPQTGAPFDPTTDTPLASGILIEEYLDEDPPAGDYDYQVFGRIPG
jgi:hypothetical protein